MWQKPCERCSATLDQWAGFLPGEEVPKLERALRFLLVSDELGKWFVQTAPETEPTPPDSMWPGALKLLQSEAVPRNRF